MGVAAVKQEEVMVYLTKHFKKRYKERVGNAPPEVQKCWIKSSLRKNTTHKLSESIYRVKLRGAPHYVVLDHRGKHRWVAITIFSKCQARELLMNEQNNTTTDEKNICSGP